MNNLRKKYLKDLFPSSSGDTIALKIGDQPEDSGSGDAGSVSDVDLAKLEALNQRARQRMQDAGVISSKYMGLDGEIYGQDYEDLKNNPAVKVEDIDPDFKQKTLNVSQDDFVSSPTLQRFLTNLAIKERKNEDVNKFLGEVAADDSVEPPRSDVRAELYDSVKRSPRWEKIKLLMGLGEYK